MNTQFAPQPHRSLPNLFDRLPVPPPADSAAGLPEVVTESGPPPEFTAPHPNHASSPTEPNDLWWEGSRLGPGVQVEHRSYVVAPPSRIRGRRSAWQLDGRPGRAPLAAMPTPWMDRLTGRVLDAAYDALSADMRHPTFDWDAPITTVAGAFKLARALLCDSHDPPPKVARPGPDASTPVCHGSSLTRRAAHAG